MLLTSQQKQLRQHHLELSSRTSVCSTTSRSLQTNVTGETKVYHSQTLYLIAREIRGRERDLLPKWKKLVRDSVYMGPKPCRQPSLPKLP